MSIEALKEQARKHEQDENWTDALQLYVEAINRQGEDDQPDLGLYNRAGDLSTRLGDSVGAIQYYEQAVELYLEAELPNNAIAILKKILRNLPDRAEVFLRMGQIRARQGFLTDARENFLLYAEKKQQDGDMDEAFRALEEFADVAPSDVDVRLALADQLHAHERSEEALDQLARAYHQYMGRGETQAAESVEQRVQEIDSNYVIPSTPPDGAIFETNTLGDADMFDADAYQEEAGLEAEFDEIALEAEDEIEVEGPAEAEFETTEDLVFDSEVGDEALEAAIEFDDASEVVDEFEAAEVADDQDESIAFGEGAFGLEEDDSADSEEFSVAAQSEDQRSDDQQEDELSDQDDWSVGAEIDDAFISFDDSETEAAPDVESTFEVGASDEESEEFAAFGADAPDSAVDESEWTDDELEEGGLGESLDEWEAVASTEESDDSASELATWPEPEGASDALDELPLLSFDGEEESFDGESAGEVETESEPATAVAALPTDEADETDELGWSDVEVSETEGEAEDGPLAESESDDLWTEVPAAEADVAHVEVAEADTAEADVPVGVEVDSDLEQDDEWIGLDADASEPEEAVTASVEDEDEDEDAADFATAEEEPRQEEPVEVGGPSLADFESYSLSDLREYVDDNPSIAPAWEQMGRVALIDGGVEESQRAFEEAHLAYAQDQDFMSAMRCIRELLLGDPDAIEYHQRLVEYAHRADDRTLQVSAYLELADCLTRTGAPAKARAVHEKVLNIDPSNRRAAAALDDGQPEPEAEATDSASQSYVDLGSMVIERSEKTTRWTVEAEEPAGEADFDFQDMLAQFRAKVAENVDVGDVQAHYDLGTAYKEMGLIEEAITEFQLALRADGQNLATYEMLGQCFMEKGQPEVAVRSLTRATEMPFDVEDELLGIYYYLGRAHEHLGNHDDAVEYYEKIFALDINFEDVTERLRALR